MISHERKERDRVRVKSENWRTYLEGLGIKRDDGLSKKEEGL